MPGMRGGAARAATAGMPAGAARGQRAAADRYSGLARAFQTGGMPPISTQQQKAEAERMKGLAAHYDVQSKRQAAEAAWLKGQAGAYGAGQAAIQQKEAVDPWARPSEGQLYRRKPGEAVAPFGSPDYISPAPPGTSLGQPGPASDAARAADAARWGGYAGAYEEGLAPPGVETFGEFGPQRKAANFNWTLMGFGEGAEGSAAGREWAEDFYNDYGYDPWEGPGDEAENLGRNLAAWYAQGEEPPIDELDYIDEYYESEGEYPWWLEQPEEEAGWGGGGWGGGGGGGGWGGRGRTQKSPFFYGPQAMGI